MVVRFEVLIAVNVDITFFGPRPKDHILKTYSQDAGKRLWSYMEMRLQLDYSALLLRRSGPLKHLNTKNPCFC